MSRAERVALVVVAVIFDTLVTSERE